MKTQTKILQSTTNLTNSGVGVSGCIEELTQEELRTVVGGQGSLGSTVDGLTGSLTGGKKGSLLGGLLIPGIL